jgi:hypothetical protein
VDALARLVAIQEISDLIGRYDDELVHDGGRWKFKRRVEHPVQYIPGPPPMSDTATGVSGATMRVDDETAVEP